MSVRQIISTWYEAVMVGGYGCKLLNTYNSKEEALKDIEETNKRVVERGYRADEYYVMRCHCVKLVEDNGDVITEVVTREKV